MDENDELSDDFLVAGTPEKKRPKKLKLKSKLGQEVQKEPKKDLCDSGHGSLILDDLLEELEKNITQPSVKQEVNVEKLVLNKENSIVNDISHMEISQLVDTENINEKILNCADVEGASSLRNTIEIKSTEKKVVTITHPLQKPHSKNSHKMYVFYLIEEVLEFSPNNCPKNSHIHLVGRISYSEKRKSYVLCSLDLANAKNNKIKLELRELSIKPNKDDYISLFCVLTFEDQNPVVAAKFFQKFTMVYSSYVELMLRLRTTIPLENFDMLSLSEEAMADEWSFQEDEPDEFIDSLRETLDSQLSQRTLLETGELGDETLYAFLDDISFEKL